MDNKRKKVYEITVPISSIKRLMAEFKHWGVTSAQYSLYGNIFYTRNSNVVDVIIETLPAADYKLERVDHSPFDIMPMRG